MPGSSAELSMKFRDVVIRWSSPHRALNGESVETVSGSLAAMKLTDARVATKAQLGLSSYFLSYDLLLHFGHVVLAMNQILSAMNHLLGRSKRNSFMLDPNYQFIKLLEGSDSRPELHIAFNTMQMRLNSARSAVLRFLFGVRAAQRGIR